MTNAQEPASRGLQLVAFINVDTATITIHQTQCGHARYGRRQHGVGDPDWLPMEDGVTTEQLKTFINENRPPGMRAIQVIRRCKHCSGRTLRTPRGTESRRAGQVGTNT